MIYNVSRWLSLWLSSFVSNFNYICLCNDYDKKLPVASQYKQQYSYTVHNSTTHIPHSCEVGGGGEYINTDNNASW